MKLTTTLAIILLLTSGAMAQMPRTISYQGVLADASGKLLPDGNHTLKLAFYDNPSSSTPLWSESQSAAVVAGTFNVIIGSVVPLPPSLAFDRAYFLGVAVDGGAELSPRTALTSVPYALRSAVADQAMSLAPGATGVVRSINGTDGVVNLQGGGGTTVNRNGSTITISSSGGGSGSGIQGVQSSDGSLAVSDANGPIADISIAENAITSSRIADGSISSSDLAAGILPTSLPPTGPAGGDLAGNYPDPVIDLGTITSSHIIDGAVTAPKIAFPLTVTFPAAGHILGVTNSGQGDAMAASSVNGSGLHGIHTGATGKAAGVVGVSRSMTTGRVDSGATGVLGVISPTGSAYSDSWSAGVRGINIEGGIGVIGYQSGNGLGVYGETRQGTGVKGVSYGRPGFAVGVGGIADSAGGVGVYGSSNRGTGVGGSSREGRAIDGSSFNVGVYGQSLTDTGYGGTFWNLAGGTGLYVVGNGAQRAKAALRLRNLRTGDGMAAYITNESGYATVHMANASTGEVLYLQSNGGRFIRAINNAENDTKFYVDYSGNVRGDGSYASPAADFAEMLPASDESLEPGDVLAIDIDGKLARSTGSYQSSVAGIYSTKPAFIGGQPVDVEIEGDIPLAVIGIVPCKVSDEGGAIHPGDLLVASSTPGHAMRADTRELKEHPGAIIGKALGTFDGEGTGTIRVLVNVK